MARINVYTYAKDEYDETTLAGWFNDDASTAYQEATRWDSNNQVSVNPVDQYSHQILYRTKGGRWVLHTWSQWQGAEPKFEFVNDATAKDWLIRNDEDDAVQKWFGELEEEAGPNLGGRPAVGPKVEFRLSEDELARVDERVKKEGVSRSEMLRRLVVTSL